MEMLIVLTSHVKFGDTSKKTSFWRTAFAAPYYVFKAAGAEIKPASPIGRPAAARLEGRQRSSASRFPVPPHIGSCSASWACRDTQAAPRGREQIRRRLLGSACARWHTKQMADDATGHFNSARLNSHASR